MKPIDFKMIRIRLDMSQWAVALKLGVSQGSVTNWERGYREIPEDIENEMKNLEKEIKD